MGGDDTSEANEVAEVQKPADVTRFLDATGFDSDRTLLTRRQAQVLVLREHGFQQATIADYLGTTRENVSGIETRARDNVSRARETAEFAALLSAPVQVELPAETDLYDAPELVFDACDEAGLKVEQNAPELMKAVSDAAGSAVDGRRIKTTLYVNVTRDGTVHVSTD